MSRTRYYVIIGRDDGSRTYKGPLALVPAIRERDVWVQQFPTYEACVQLVDAATKADCRAWSKAVKAGDRYYPLETVDQMLGVDDDYERSACPACGDPDCQFPPACQAAIGPMPARGWPHHDEDDEVLTNA